jgi:hypothetical protein
MHTYMHTYMHAYIHAQAHNCGANLGGTQTQASRLRTSGTSVYVNVIMQMKEFSVKVGTYYIFHILQNVCLEYRNITYNNVCICNFICMYM